MEDTGTKHTYLQPCYKNLQIMFNGKIQHCHETMLSHTEQQILGHCMHKLPKLIGKPPD